MKTKRFWNWMPAALLLAVLLALFTSMVAAAQDAPPPIPTGPDGAGASAAPIATDNHTPGTAPLLQCGSIASDAIGASGEVDYYRLELGAGTPIVVTITNAGAPLDAVLNLYDANGTTFVTDQDDFHGANPRLHYNTRFNDPGGFGAKYYVRVHSFDGAGSANYTYQLSWRGIQYVSMTTAGSVGGVSYEPGDILARTNCGSSDIRWEMFFDGSDVGFDGNVRDFAVLNGSPAAPFRRGAIILSTGSAEPLPDIGTLALQDLALFQPTAVGSTTTGTYHRYFDGSDVGYNVFAESIDSVAVHHASNTLVLGTAGKAKVKGGLIAADEDLLQFTPQKLGAATAGSWSMFFDGSDVGLGTVDLEGVDLLASSTSPDGILFGNLDRDITLNGILFTPNKVAGCGNATFGANTVCTWGQSHTAWRLGTTGMTALDGYDYGTHIWPGNFVPTAAEAETQGASSK